MTKAETIMNKLAASKEAIQRYEAEIRKMRLLAQPNVTDTIRDHENMDNHVYPKGKR